MKSIRCVLGFHKLCRRNRENSVSIEYVCVDCGLVDQVISFPSSPPSGRGSARSDKSVFEVMKFEIAKLELKPGDVLVLKTPRVLNAKEFEYLAEEMKKIAAGNTFVIHQPGFDFDIIRSVDTHA